MQLIATKSRERWKSLII